MEKIKQLKPILPLTFQKAEIKRHYKNDIHSSTIAVKNIHTDAMSSYNFYRPISKTLSL